MSWRRRLIFLTVPYLLLFAILAGIEITVRLKYPYIPGLQVFVKVVFEGIARDNEKEPVFRGDPWLSWGFRPNLKDVGWNDTTFSTNDWGIRYPKSLKTKGKNTFRVVCLGDSVTFGFRIGDQKMEGKPNEYDPRFENYARVMEDRLRADNPGRDVEVVPMGVPGYTTHQGLIWLRRDIAKLKPDVVTVCFGFNDTHTRAQSDKETIPTDWGHVALRRLMNLSQAAIYFTQWREQRAAKLKEGQPPPPNKVVSRVSKEDYVANILEMARITREHGAQPLIIAPVFRDRVAGVDQGLLIMAYRKALMEGAEKSKIPMVEVKEVSMTDYPLNSPIFGEQVHPNEIGHRIMANELLEFMADRGLLKDLSIGAH